MSEKERPTRDQVAAWFGVPTTLADALKDDKDRSHRKPILAARSKYHREITGVAMIDGREQKVTMWVDFYDVVKAFDVRCGALQHVIKKALAAGDRGHKDLATDMQDIVDSAIRARELAE